MGPDELHAQLRKLHEELAHVSRVDPHSSQLLGDIMRDIMRLTDRQSGSVSTTSVAALPDRLERIAVQFEAAHPTLAASSRRLVDLLGKAGL